MYLRPRIHHTDRILCTGGYPIAWSPSPLCAAIRRVTVHGYPMRSEYCLHSRRQQPTQFPSDQSASWPEHLLRVLRELVFAFSLPHAGIAFR